jgi:S1-C subfamily serine protease
MTRRYRMVAVLLLGSWLLISAIPLHALAQLDPTVRDRVLPAAVQIAIIVKSTENGIEEWIYVPVGSGTVISPNGFILTNRHVIDMDAHRDELARWVTGNAGDDLTLDLDEDEVLILRASGNRAPEPLYRARIAEQSAELDLAVLQITATRDGTPVDVELAALPYVSLADSDDLQLGEPIDIFSYPLAGGDTLTYTTGVVSGFNFEEGLESPAWITTDATISGGSSGGTAVNRRGELIGVPTQGSSLDCRPGDTNLDGVVDAQDVGCIPVGGSIGQLRPINFAPDMLDRAGADVVHTGATGAYSLGNYESDVTEVEDDPSTNLEEPGNPQPEIADYCASGPLFPVGTRLAVGREIRLFRDPAMIPL